MSKTYGNTVGFFVGKVKKSHRKMRVMFIFTQINNRKTMVAVGWVKERFILDFVNR